MRRLTIRYDLVVVECVCVCVSVCVCACVCQSLEKNLSVCMYVRTYVHQTSR